MLLSCFRLWICYISWVEGFQAISKGRLCSTVRSPEGLLTFEGDEDAGWGQTLYRYPKIVFYRNSTDEQAAPRSVQRAEQRGLHEDGQNEPTKESTHAISRSRPARRLKRLPSHAEVRAVDVKRNNTGFILISALYVVVGLQKPDGGIQPLRCGVCQIRQFAYMQGKSSPAKALLNGKDELKVVQRAADWTVHGFAWSFAGFWG